MSIKASHDLARPSSVKALIFASFALVGSASFFCSSFCEASLDLTPPIVGIPIVFLGDTITFSEVSFSGGSSLIGSDVLIGALVIGAITFFRCSPPTEQHLLGRVNVLISLA